MRNKIPIIWAWLSWYGVDIKQSVGNWKKRSIIQNVTDDDM